jgi:hypothetical protein
MSRGWGYASASVIGTSHLKTPDETCQDSNLCAYLPSVDAFVGVVSDGAGSASHGADGSMIACEVVLDECAGAGLVDIHSREFSIDVIGSVRNRILSTANGLGLRERDFACTMLVAIIGKERSSFWQIGDGAICFRLLNESPFRFAFWPSKGEYANVTEFVTDADFLSALNFDSGEYPVADIALFSDGLERLALDFNANEVHTPFLAGLFPYLHRRQEGRLHDMDEQLASFLGSERVNKCTDDDKTLILATRDNENAT